MPSSWGVWSFRVLGSDQGFWAENVNHRLLMTFKFRRGNFEAPQELRMRLGGIRSALTDTQISRESQNLKLCMGAPDVSELYAFHHTPWQVELPLPNLEGHWTPCIRAVWEQSHCDQRSHTGICSVLMKNLRAF